MIDLDELFKSFPGGRWYRVEEDGRRVPVSFHQDMTPEARAAAEHLLPEVLPCVRCSRTLAEHAGKKCLFGPSEYEAFTGDPFSAVLWKVAYRNAEQVGSQDYSRRVAAFDCKQLIKKMCPHPEGRKRWDHKAECFIIYCALCEYQIGAEEE